MTLERRTFLTGLLAGAGLTASCSRTLAPRYFGWLFVASAAEKCVAIADLAEFKRAGTIALPQAPAQVLRSGERMFVTCPEARALFEIDTAHHQLAGRIPVPGRLVTAAAVPEQQNLLAVLLDDPAALVLMDVGTRRTATRVALPGPPAALDVSGTAAAVSLAGDGAIARVSFATGKLSGFTETGSRCPALRFRNDGQTLLGGLSDAKQVIAVDSASGSMLARLPLPFAPARFCFNADGGQMFVTGGGEDSIAIVDTYQNQVDQTIIAGRTPYGMAVSGDRNLLLVTNPGSGDLTILDIETRLLAASVHVGGNPGDVLLTPDGQYALVLNRDSGDVAVVRLNTVLDHKVKTKPLFTVFAMAPGPTSTAILPARG